MRILMTFCAPLAVLLLASGIVEAAQKLSIPAEGLSARCYEHYIYVSQNGKEIYTSSQYFNSSRCPEDANQLNVRFEAAKMAGKSILVDDSWSATAAFQLASENDGGILVSPDELGLRCIGQTLYDSRGSFVVDKRLTITLGRRIIYQSTRYTGDSGCSSDATVAVQKINRAQAARKMILIKHNDSPDADITITNDNIK